MTPINFQGRDKDTSSFWTSVGPAWCYGAWFGSAGSLLGLSLFLMLMGAVSFSLDHVVCFPKESIIAAKIFLATESSGWSAWLSVLAGGIGVVGLIGLVHPGTAWKNLWWPPRRLLALIGLLFAWVVGGMWIPMWISGKNMGPIIGLTFLSSPHESSMAAVQEAMFIAVVSWVFLLLVSQRGVMGWANGRGPLTFRSALAMGGQSVVVGVGTEGIGIVALWSVGILFRGGVIGIESGPPESVLLLLTLFTVSLTGGGWALGMFWSAYLVPDLRRKERVARGMMAAGLVAVMATVGYPIWKTYQGHIQTADHLRAMFRKAALESIPVVVGGHGSEGVVHRPKYANVHEQWTGAGTWTHGVHRAETINAALVYASEHDFLEATMGNPLWKPLEHGFKARFVFVLFRCFYLVSSVLIHRMMGLASLGQGAASPENRQWAASLWNPRKYYYGSHGLPRLVAVYAHLRMTDLHATTDKKARDMAPPTLQSAPDGGSNVSPRRMVQMDHGVIQGRVDVSGKILKVVLYRLDENKEWPPKDSWAEGFQKRNPPGPNSGMNKREHRNVWTEAYQVGRASEAVEPRADGSFAFHHLQEGSYYLGVVMDPSGFPQDDKGIQVSFPLTPLSLSPAQATVRVPAITIRFKTKQ